MVSDELCQTLHDGTLAHTGLTDQDGVVLLSSSQNLDDALNLLLTSYTGIQRAVDGSLRQVGAEGVEHGCLRVLFLLGSGRSRRAGTGRSVLLTSLLVFLLVFIGQADAVGYFFIL